MRKTQKGLKVLGFFKAAKHNKDNHKASHTHKDVQKYHKDMKNNWETKSEKQKNTLVPSVGLLKAYAEGLIVPHSIHVWHRF